MFLGWVFVLKIDQAFHNSALGYKRWKLYVFLSIGSVYVLISWTIGFGLGAWNEVKASYNPDYGTICWNPGVIN